MAIFNSIGAGGGSGGGVNMDKIVLKPKGVQVNTIAFPLTSEDGNFTLSKDSSQTYLPWTIIQYSNGGVYGNQTNNYTDTYTLENNNSKIIVGIKSTPMYEGASSVNFGALAVSGYGYYGNSTSTNQYVNGFTMYWLGSDEVFRFGDSMSYCVLGQNNNSLRSKLVPLITGSYSNTNYAYPSSMTNYIFGKTDTEVAIYIFYV